MPAKSLEEAWDTAWKKVSRMQGGDYCLKVTILGQHIPIQPHTEDYAG